MNPVMYWETLAAIPENFAELTAVHAQKPACAEMEQFNLRNPAIRGTPARMDHDALSQIRLRNADLEKEHARFVVPITIFVRMNAKFHSA